MSVKDIMDYITSSWSHITFVYDNNNCGIDPRSYDDIIMWFGENSVHVNGFEEVTKIKLFDGKSLDEICDKIEYVDY